MKCLVGVAVLLAVAAAVAVAVYHEPPLQQPALGLGLDHVEDRSFTISEVTEQNGFNTVTLTLGDGTKVLALVAPGLNIKMQPDIQLVWLRYEISRSNWVTIPVLRAKKQ